MESKSKVYYRLICCSQNNSAAIGADGEVYVWGRGKNGLICNQDLQGRTIPTKVTLPKESEYLKVIHISMGLYHMLAIVQNSILKNVNKDVLLSDNVMKVIEKQREVILNPENPKGILEYFSNYYEMGPNVAVAQKQKHQKGDNNNYIENASNSGKKILYEDKYVEIEDFLRFVEYVGVAVTNQTEAAYMNEFVQAMCLDQPELVNVYQYYYFVHNDEPFHMVFSWGTDMNGRLGLSQQQIQDNELKRERLFTINKDYAQNKNSNDLDQTNFLNLSQMSLLENVKNSTTKNSNINEQKKSILQLQFKQKQPNMQQEEEDENDNRMTLVKPTKIMFGKIDVKKVACGAHHSLALDNNGMIYSWGSGGQSCLGVDSINDIKQPFLITKKQDHFIDIECGSFHNLALSNLFDVYSWGSGMQGQLGHGQSIRAQATPLKIQFPSDDIKIKQIAAGDQHSACISNENEMYTFGGGSFYKLGHGLPNDEYFPKKVVAIEDVYVTDVSCGASHTMCITNEGFVYAWGSGSCGKLGIFKNSTANQMLPQRIGQYQRRFRRSTFNQVCAGPVQSFVITDVGALYAWGSCKNGILGLGKLQDNVYLPQKIYNAIPFYINLQKEESLIKFIDIYALKPCLESNYKNIKDFLDQIIPPHEYVVQGRPIKMVVCSENNSFYLTHEGLLYAAGDASKGLLVKDPSYLQKKFQIKKAQKVQNEMQQVQKINVKQGNQIRGSNLSNARQYGIDDVNSQVFPCPIRIKFFNHNRINFISCSMSHVIAINHCGQAYSWGENMHYQLGQGHQSKFEFVPKKILGALENKQVIMSSCADKYSAFLTKEGEVWTVGTSENGVGGLEDKTTYLIQYPKMINDIPQMAYISTGQHHVMAISNENNLYAWGNNIYGQLGLGNKQSEEEPTTKPNKNIAQLQDEEQCDDANTAVIYKPKKVEIDIKDGKISIVAVGLYHSVAITRGGDICACGLKKYAGFPQEAGQDPSVNSFKIITSLFNQNLKFKMVSCSSFHSIAISTDGALYGWGSSAFGRLGAIDKEKDQSQAQSQQDRTSQTQKVTMQKQNVIRSTIQAKPVPGDMRKWKEMQHEIIQPQLIFKDKFGLCMEQDESQSQSHHKQAVYVSCGNFATTVVSQEAKVYSCGSVSNGRSGISLNKLLRLTLNNFQNQDEGNFNFQNSADEIYRLLRVKCGNKNGTSKYLNGELQTMQQSSQQIQRGQRALLQTQFLDEKQSNLNRKSTNVNSPMNLGSVLTKQLLGFQQVQQQGGDTPTQQSGQIKKSSQQQQKQEQADVNSDQSDEIKSSDVMEEKSLDSGIDEVQDNEFSNYNIPSGEQQRNTNVDIKGRNGRQSVMSQMSQNYLNVSQNQTLNQSYTKSLQKQQQQMKQDQLQLQVYQESSEEKEEALVAKDVELQRRMQMVIKENGDMSSALKLEYQKVRARLDAMIYSKVHTLCEGHIKRLELFHSTPLFILQNIQIYETLFSLLQQHPCYLMSIIKTQALSAAQIKHLLQVLYGQYENVSAIITLSQLVFQHEMTESFQIRSIKQEIVNIKVGSLFWQLYSLLFHKQQQNLCYIATLANFVLNECLGEPAQKLVDEQIEYFLKAHEDGTAQSQIQQETLDLKIKSLMGSVMDLYQPFSSSDVNANHKFTSLKLQLQLNAINKVTSRVNEDMKKAEQLSVQLVSKELSYLHSLFAGIFVELRRKEEFEQYTLQHSKMREEQQVELQRDTFNNVQLLPDWDKHWASLQEKVQQESEFLIINLYFSQLIHLLKHHSQYEMIMVSDWVEGFMHDSNNVNSMADCIEKLFMQQPLQQGINSQADGGLSLDSLNEVLLGGFLDHNQQTFKHLINFGFFNLSLDYLQEVLAASYSYKQLRFSISLEFIFVIHNLVCHIYLQQQQQQPSQLSQQDSFFLRGKQDPIYIMFSYLKFRTIPISAFKSSILEQKVNLTSVNMILQEDKSGLQEGQNSQNQSQNSQNQSCSIQSQSLYRCRTCHVLLPLSLLRTKHNEEISVLQTHGWVCPNSQCQNKNGINDLKCVGFNCGETMPPESVGKVSLFDRYYPTHDLLLQRFLLVLKSVEPFKEAQYGYGDASLEDQFLEFFNSQIEKEQKKMERLDLLLLLKDFKDQLESSDSTHKHSANANNQKEMNFKEMYKVLQGKAKVHLQEKKRHMKYQQYLEGVLQQMAMMTKDKQNCSKTAILELLQVEATLLHHTTHLPPRYLSELDNNLDVIKEHAAQPELLFLKQCDQENKKLSKLLFNSVGLFSQHEFVHLKVIQKVLFKGKDIPNIRKSIRFYVLAKELGGFQISVVYLNDSWSNIFVTCIPYLQSLYNSCCKTYCLCCNCCHVNTLSALPAWINPTMIASKLNMFYTEVALQTCHLSADRYQELKRTANYKPILTLGSSHNVQVQFNVSSLVDVLRKIESQILIRLSATPINLSVNYSQNVQTKKK